ncbi:MAG: hypothetical protein WCW47_00930 [Candidatus Paceibacterota bacterium]|jgi:hypothetical protein
MPNNRILFVLIICFGVVASVYLLARNSASPQTIGDTTDVSVNPYINLDKNTNNDWKKILVNLDSSNSTTTILTNEDPGVFNETTLTAQMSRDFLSQYLSAIKNGPVTPEEAAKIAETTLLIPEYTKGVRVKYNIKNLHVINNTNTNTIEVYGNTLNQSLKDKSSQVKENPIEIFNNAITSASETKLAKLDQIIFLNKSLLTDLLTMNVPKSAIEVHLALLNVTSSLLSDLEAMRLVFIDPVAGLIGISQYQTDTFLLKTALTNMNTYLMQN